MDLRSFVMLKFLLPLFREREAKRVADAGFFANIVAAMTVNGPEDINGLIAAWSNGDEEAFGRLMSLVYPELRRIARQHLSRRPAGHSLESAALANEAYLKLVRARGLRCESRVHFLALCSQIIRRILVDHARTRRYAKRGGGVVQIALGEEVAAAGTRQVEVLALDEALASLSKFGARKGRLVELRYFGGLSVEEAAQLLGVSPVTAKRDWKVAKAWLLHEPLA